MTDSAAPMRCVVVQPRGGGERRAPASLLAGLSQRRLDVVVASDPPGVMVELARKPTAVVVVVEPAQQPQTAELVCAIRAYYPRVVCWRYDVPGSGRAGLSAINGVYDADPPTKPTDPGPPTTPADPVEDDELERVLGSTRQRIDPLVNRVPGPTMQTNGSPLISEEELAMLLGEADDPAWHERDGG